MQEPLDARLPFDELNQVVQREESEEEKTSKKIEQKNGLEIAESEISETRVLFNIIIHRSKNFNCPLPGCLHHRVLAGTIIQVCGQAALQKVEKPRSSIKIRIGQK